MIEGKDLKGYHWIRDTRFDGEYYYLKDFEYLVVMKVIDSSGTRPRERWEAIIFADEHYHQVLGRQ